MSHHYDKNTNELVIDGFEGGIAPSPYEGIGNIQNLTTAYYPGVAYVNYRRQPATLTEIGTFWYAGSHSVNVSNNVGWMFLSSVTSIANPLHKATSPSGLNYVLDSSGDIWKQSAVNSSTFNLLGTTGRVTNGSGGLAWWNNYLIVFGNGTIEFCGDGTGDAGITGTNWNINTSSPATVNLTIGQYGMSTGAPVSPVNYHFTSAPLSGATSATLNTNWTPPSGVYSVRFDNGASDVRAVTFTQGNTGVSWTGGLTTNTADTNFNMYQLAATNNTFFGSSQFVAGDGVTFSSTGTLPAGITAGTIYYLQENVDITGNTSTFYVTATQNSTNFKDAIILNDAGTGTTTMSMVPSNSPPIKNTTITGFNWGTAGLGSTTITLSSLWLEASGIYNIVDPAGNNFTGAFTFNSTNVVLTNPAAVQLSPSGTFMVQILNPSATTNKTYVSKVDGNLYFANGRWVGRISSSPNFNINFNPSVPASYSVNYAATGTLQPQDTVVDMTDLQRALIIAGNKDLYSWDYVSAQPNAPSPVGEQIAGIINVLNNIYILAGQKGNSYVFNGSYAQFLYKIPDYIAGIIDPIWTYGGIMGHRSRIYFQAMAQDTSGNNILYGVFSLHISPAITGEVASGLVMEAQNSVGLVPAPGTVGTGVLIDNEPSSNGQDSYYSAYSTGASAGAIDYNDSTLWQNFEPTIETDIIPIGSILDKQTFGQIQFKLDRPMKSGDQIRMYWRASLSDSYTLMGTTASQQLSDYYPSNVSQSQWVQFKIQFKAASSNSSFIPLREVRVQIV